MKKVLLFLLIVSSCFYYAAAQTDSVSYYYKGRKISFAVSYRQLIVGVKKGYNQTSRRVSMANEFGVNADSIKQLTQSNQLIIKLTNDQARLSAKNIRDYLSKNTEVTYIHPSIAGRDNRFASYGEDFVVKLKAQIKYSELEKLLTKNQCRLKRNYLFEKNIYILSAEKANNYNALRMANLFFETGLFEFSEPDFTIHNALTDAPNDPLYYLQWAHKNTGSVEQYSGVPGADMRVDSAWLITKGSAKIKIAVIDEGVDTSHPDLKNNLLQGFDCVTLTSNPGDGYYYGNNGHGTSCAGIIAAVANNGIGIAGVAPECKIIPVNLAYEQENFTSMANIAAGVDYSWQNGASVISNSWGSNIYSSVLDDAIHRAVTMGRNGKGALVFFATGNDNGSIFYPAVLPEVIAVGGITMCNQRKAPDNTCAGGFWGANYGKGLDVVAPCVNTVSTDNVGIYGYNHDGDYYEYFGGTSSACPHAAAVAALVLSVDSTLTGAEVRVILETSCDKIPGYSFALTEDYPNGTWNNELGYGRVNAYKSVLAAKNKTFCTVMVAAAGYTTICEGSSVPLKVVNPVSGTSYYWQYNDTSIDSTGSSLAVSKAGHYNVIATSANGCVAMSPPVIVNVREAKHDLKASAGTTVSLCSGGTGAIIGGVPSAVGGTPFIADKRAYGMDNSTATFQKFKLDDPANYDTISSKTLTDLEIYFQQFYTAADFTPMGYYAFKRRSNDLIRLDTATGNKTIIGSPAPESGEWSGLAWNPISKQLIALSSFSQNGGNSRLYKVNLVNGSVIPLMTVNSNAIYWIAFSKEGVLFALSGNNVVKIDVVTGGVTPLPNPLDEEVTGQQDAAFDPLDDKLYASLNYNAEFPYFYTICNFRSVDTATGEMKLIGSLSKYSKTAGIAIAGGVYKYSWSPAEGLSNPSDANPTANPPVSTTYKLTVTDLCGNTDTSSVRVIAGAAKPSIKISAPVDSICRYETVRLSATKNNNYYYQWYNNGRAIAGANDSFYIAERTGRLQVSVTNGPGGCENTSQSFLVKDCSILLNNNNTDTTCASYFYPSRGFRDSSYRKNEVWIKTVYPSTSGNKLKINFSNFKMYAYYSTPQFNPNDTLFLYDGTDINGPLIAAFTIADAPYLNHDYYSISGPITFKFKSGVQNDNTGTWDAFISCYTPHVYRTKSSGRFADPKIWQVKLNDGRFANATAFPQYNEDSIIIQTGHKVTIDTGFITLDQCWVQKGATLIAKTYFNLYDGDSTDLRVDGTLQQIGTANIYGKSSIVFTGNFDAGNSTVKPLCYFIGQSPQTLTTHTAYIDSLYISGNANVTANGNINGYLLKVNTTGKFVMNNIYYITRLLGLKKGIIDTKEKGEIYLAYSVQVDGGSAASFVNGTLSRGIGTVGLSSEFFPVGINDLYKPVVLHIAKPYSGDILRVRLYNKAPLPRILPAGIDTISDHYYCNVQSVYKYAITDGSINLNYLKDDGVLDPDNLRILKDDGKGNWINIGGQGTSKDTGSITSAVNFTSYGDFVLANASGGSNVLPVTWLQFSVSLKGKVAELLWKVTQQKDVSYYDAEYSTDGVEFKALTQVPVKNGNTSPITYQWQHLFPVNGVNFYRIKQVDKNDHFSYSKTEKLKVNAGNNYKIMPNPATDEIIVTADKEIKEINCYDMQGRLLQTVKPLAIQYKILLAQLPAGVYNIQITTANQVHNAKLIKQ